MKSVPNAECYMPAKISGSDGCPLINEVTPPDEEATILFPTGHINNRFTRLDKLRRRSEANKLYN